MNAAIARVLTDVFSEVAVLSWRGAWLIVAVFALRLLVRGRVPAQVWFVIWLVVGARLLVPFSVPAHWSPYNLTAVATVAPRQAVESVALPRQAPTQERAVVLTQAGDVPDAMLPPASAAEPPKLAPAAAAESAGARATPARFTEQVLATVWFAGVLVLLAARVAAAWRFRRQLRSALSAGGRVDEITAQEAATLRVVGGVTCLETTAIGAPALFGVVRPRLLFPPGLAAKLDDAELRLVIRHELAHWRRRDLLAQGLMHAATVVHWFNPLVWAASRMARADCELACDEFVLRRDTPAQAYGAALLKVLGLVRGRRSPAHVVAILESRQQLANRVSMIAGYRASTLARAAAGMLLVGGFAAVSLTRESHAGVAPAQSAAAAAAGGVRHQASVAREAANEKRLPDAAPLRPAAPAEALSLDRKMDVATAAVKVAHAEAQRAGMAVAAAEVRLKQIKEYQANGRDLVMLPFIANHPLVVQLVTKLSDQSLERATLHERYRERHPKMVQIEHTLAQTQELLARAIAAVCQQLEAEYQAAVHTHEAAQRELDKRTKEAGEVDTFVAQVRAQSRGTSAPVQPTGPVGAVPALDQREEGVSSRQSPPPVAARGPRESEDEFVVSVVGAVNTQSAVALSTRHRPILLDAIARAGGFAAQADRAGVRVLRAGPDGTRTALAITEDALMTGRSPDTLLQSGDVIIVPERPAAEPKVATVLGAINQAGRITLPDSGTLTIVEAIAMAGGPTRVADLKRVRVRRSAVSRHGAELQVHTVNVDELLRGPSTGGPPAEFMVQPGDVISVPERVL